MTSEPQWLTSLQMVLRSVTFICAFVGIGYAYHDWFYWKDRPDSDPSVKHSSSVITFALVCLVAIFYTPVTFANIMDNFDLSPVIAGVLRSVSLSFLLAYFFIMAVRRLQAFEELDPAIARRKATSIFVGMVAVALVGFYGQ